MAKLRKLLLSLGDAKIVEEKTSNPANFSIIGVEDPTQPGATGAEITRGRAGRQARRNHRQARPAKETSRAAAARTRAIIVEPAISVESEPRFWIDSRLIDVPAASIQSVEVKPATGAGYVIRRLKPNEDGFSLEGAPAGRKAADSHALAPSTTLLSGLTAEDVAAAKDIDFSKSSQAIMTLSDGDVITVTGTPLADKRWIQVKATKDAALDSKTQGRAFELASYRYDAIFRPLEQLLVPKEAAGARQQAHHPGDKPPSVAPGGVLPVASRPASGLVISGTSAGFGRRLAALIYDSLLLAALLMIVYGRGAGVHARRGADADSAGPWLVRVPRR